MAELSPASKEHHVWPETRERAEQLAAKLTDRGLIRDEHYSLLARYDVVVVCCHGLYEELIREEAAELPGRYQWATFVWTV